MCLFSIYDRPRKIARKWIEKKNPTEIWTLHLNFSFRATIRYTICTVHLYKTWYSQAVNHLSTDHARCLLIGRKLVYQPDIPEATFGVSNFNKLHELLILMWAPSSYFTYLNEESDYDTPQHPLLYSSKQCLSLCYPFH